MGQGVKVGHGVPVGGQGVKVAKGVPVGQTVPGATGIFGCA